MKSYDVTRNRKLDEQHLKSVDITTLPFNEYVFMFDIREWGGIEFCLRKIILHSTDNRDSFILTYKIFKIMVEEELRIYTISKDLTPSEKEHHKQLNKLLSKVSSFIELFNYKIPVVAISRDEIITIDKIVEYASDKVTKLFVGNHTNFSGDIIRLALEPMKNAKKYVKQIGEVLLEEINKLNRQYWDRLKDSKDNQTRKENEKGNTETTD